MTSPLILVTNDDGIGAAGLRAAAEAMNSLGEVIIVAPATQQTGMGRSFPRSERQGVIEVLRGSVAGREVPFHAVWGSPAQAVAHAVLELCPRQPALCVSGINDGENLGGTNLLSGTVGAALEASGFGIPSIAISVGPENSERSAATYKASDWSVPIGILQRFSSLVLRRGLPTGVSVLNINIPSDSVPATEIRWTTQSRQMHYTCVHPGPRDFSRPLRLPVEARIDFASLEPESDLFAFFVDRVVSVTPLGCDLTVRGITGVSPGVRCEAFDIGEALDDG